MVTCFPLRIMAAVAPPKEPGKMVKAFLHRPSMAKWAGPRIIAVVVEFGKNSRSWLHNNEDLHCCTSLKV